MMSEIKTETHLSKKDIRRTALRWQFMTSNAYNYESQQAAGVVFSLSKALRKIYQNDEEGYRSSLDNHFKFFNTTGPAASLILGATLAMEDREGRKSQPAVQSLKTGLMGPLAGVGDTIFWVLIPTVFGSIAAYMGLQGNPTGAIIWFLANILVFLFRIKIFEWGYATGTRLVTDLGSKLNAFTEAASIMGLTVIGALIPSVIKMNLATTFATGKVKMSVQKDILDAIMPSLLPAILTYLVYRIVLTNKLSISKIIWILIGFSLVLSYFGILKA
ncbi:PTS system mannose/fructose/sorbose family transporter subunit IID [Leuconostoc sp. JNUCC 76]